MSTPAPSIRIRQAKPEDAPEAGRICYEAFAAINAKHNFPPDFPSGEAGIGLMGMLFSHPNFYCVVAEQDGKVIGSNCLDERTPIAGVGPITVDPSIQNQGIGRALMNAVLDRSRERGFAGTRLLQSAFHNRSLSLYTKLGFDPREPMSVMGGFPMNANVPGVRVRPATESDMDDANRVCERVHGHHRAGELRDGISQGIAVVAERDGRITGYASGFGYFGHAVGESNLEMKALIASASPSDIRGPGVIVPTRNAELFRWCLENGLRVVSPLTLMTIGLYNEPTGAYMPSILY